MISKGNATRIEYKSAKFETFTLTDFSDPRKDGKMGEDEFQAKVRAHASHKSEFRSGPIVQMVDLNCDAAPLGGSDAR